MCPLSLTRTQVVRGEGTTNQPDILFVGEGPGEQEDRTGRPFVGKAGLLLRSTLEVAGVDLDRCRITNTVHCRPTDEAGKNRKPLVQEIEACNPWLSAEIEATRPKLIVALGDTALKGLFGSGKKAKYKDLKITEARSRTDLVYEYQDYVPPDLVINCTTPVTAAFHPSYALRSPGQMSSFVRDCERIAELAGFRAGVDQTRDYHEIPLVAAWGMLEAMADQDVSLDTEYEEDGELVCFSFSYAEAQAYVVILPKNDVGFDPNGTLEHGAAAHFISSVFKVAGRVWFHNAKADLPVLQKIGVEVDESKVHDTIHISYVLGYRPLALKSLASNRMGLTVIRLDELRDKGETIRSIVEKDRAGLVRYSAQDADITLRLAKNEWEGLHQ